MAYLRVYLNNTLLDQYELADDTLTIGRTSDNDIVLDNPGVSSHHAEVKAEGIGHILIDRNSTNGTFINNQRIKKQQLAFRDEIQIYNFILKYMPRARLETTDEQPTEAGASPSEHAATVEIAISDVKALKNLRKRRQFGQLILMENGQKTQRHTLRDVRCSLGRGADVHVGGWFAPKKAALITRQHDTYRLTPYKRGKVRLNGLPVNGESILKQGDHISVRGNDYLFQYTSENAN